MASRRGVGRAALAVVVLAGIGLVLWLVWSKDQGPRPVGPPAGQEHIRLGMSLDELKSAVPGLVQPKAGFNLFEVRPSKPDPYNMITFLLAGGRLIRALFFVDPEKSSVAFFEKEVQSLQQRIGRSPDHREDPGKNPQRTWCDKLHCVSVRLLHVPVPGMRRDQVFVVYETEGAHRKGTGNVKVFDMTGKLPAPPPR